MSDVDISREACFKIVSRLNWYAKLHGSQRNHSRRADYQNEADMIIALRAALDRAEADIADLQYLSDTGQFMEQIANLKDRESYLVDLLDRITNYQAVIDCLSMPELNEVSCTLAAYEKGENT
jgi:hypothetical protein